MAQSKVELNDKDIMKGMEGFESEERAAKARERKAKEQQEISSYEVTETEQKQILLPQGMSTTMAMRVLYEKKVQEETEVAVVEIVDAWPLDGAVAFQYVLEKRYGFVNQVPIPGFFGSAPPVQYGVRIDAEGNTKQVNWGRMELSVLGHGYLETGYAEENGTMKFQIGGKVKKKYLNEVKAIAQQTRERVRKHSIYKGKAVRLDFRDEDGERKDFLPQDSPEFLAIDPERLDDVIYNDEVKAVVEMALLNPIKYPQQCREIGVPLKRGALLEGPFGTGKTLTAYQMAAHGNKSGFTFIYLMDVRDLDLAMRFAEHYAPAIVFAEDLDQVARLGMRDKSEVNRLTNILDGVDSKSREIFTVFTTNYKSAIDGVFIRPGRIDCVVTLEAPDQRAAVALVRKYGRNEKGESILDASLTDEAIARAVNCLVEMEANAAFYREAVERSKLSALPLYVETGNLVLGEHELATAAISMQSHIELLKAQSPDADGRNTVAEDVIMRAVMGTAMPPPNVFRKMMKAMRPRTGL